MNFLICWVSYPLIMKKTISLLLLFASTSAFGGWTDLGVGSKNTNFFADFDTLQRKNNIVRVWTKHEYKTPQPTSIPSVFMLSENFYTEFDCQEKKFRALSSNTFSENQLQGSLIASNSTPNPWTYVPPDTIASSILNKVCKK